MEQGDWENWDHITKLDPDKDISGEEIAEVCESGTDAIMLGGTQRVTAEKVKELHDVVENYDLPITLEPSNPYSVVYDLDWIFVPSVLNAGDMTWVADAHKDWIQNNDDIRWGEITVEGYIVLNPDSAVAELTDAKSRIDVDEVVAYATVGDKIFNLPIIYIEYSGTYGDPSVVEEVSNVVDDATLFYGGGIDSYEKAKEMAENADTVIVGNAVYEEGPEALKETVRGATKTDHQNK